MAPGGRVSSGGSPLGGGVAALVGGEVRRSLVLAGLEALVERELLVRRPGSRFPGEEELAFRHALLREGAYAMLTEEDRALGHRLAGEWLEARDEPAAQVRARARRRKARRCIMRARVRQICACALLPPIAECR